MAFPFSSTTPARLAMSMTRCCIRSTARAYRPVASECGFSKMVFRVLRRFLLASSSLELLLIASRNREMSFNAKDPTFFTFFSTSSPSSIPSVSIMVNACRASSVSRE